MMLPPKHCPECGAEYVHSMSLCADCGVALVLERAPVVVRELPPVSELQRVRTATLSWSRSFAARLEAAGIAYRVELEPEPDGTAAATRGERRSSVYVRREDFEVTARLDAEHLRLQIPDVPEDFGVAAPAEDLCPACGETADLAAAECASCGLAFRDADPA